MVPMTRMSLSNNPGTQYAQQIYYPQQANLVSFGKSQSDTLVNESDGLWVRHIGRITENSTHVGRHCTVRQIINMFSSSRELQIAAYQKLLNMSRSENGQAPLIEIKKAYQPETDRLDLDNTKIYLTERGQEIYQTRDGKISEWVHGNKNKIVAGNLAAITTGTVTFNYYSQISRFISGLASSII